MVVTSIIDNGTTIQLTVDGAKKEVQKDGLLVDIVDSQYIRLYLPNARNFNIKFTDVLTPVTGSIDALRAAIKTMIDGTTSINLLQEIADNTANITISSESVNLNTDGLEAQIANLEVAIGDPSDAEATSDIGSFSTIAFTKRLLTKFTTLNTKQDTIIQHLEDIHNLDTFMIQKGLVSGVSIVNKSGRNSVITSASAPEDMWNGSSVYTGFPTGSPEVLQFFSSSASDTGVVTYYYLATSSSTVWQTATVTLNGTTPVLGVSAYRVHTAYYNNGSTANVGTITCRHSVTTANVFFLMPVGTSQTYVAAYTIPTGSTGFIKKVFCDVNTTNSVSMQGALWVRRFGTSPRLQRNFNISNSINYKDEDVYIKLPEQTDITIRITQSSSAASQAVIGGFDIIIINQIL